MFAHIFQHEITTLEVGDLHLIARSTVAVPRLADVLPNLRTIKARLPPDATSFKVLHEILSDMRGIIRVERLVDETESPDETRRDDEECMQSTRYTSFWRRGLAIEGTLIPQDCNIHHAEVHIIYIVRRPH